MPDRLFRKPDEFSGPAALGREPVVLPDKRRKALRRIQRMMD